MKLQKETGGRLKTVAAGLKTAPLSVKAVKESIRTQQEPDQEQEVKAQLLPWERRAWGKLSARRKMRLLEPPGRRQEGNAKDTAGPDMWSGGNTPAGWRRDGRRGDRDTGRGGNLRMPATEEASPHTAVEGTGAGGHSPSQEAPGMGKGTGKPASRKALAKPGAPAQAPAQPAGKLAGGIPLGGAAPARAAAKKTVGKFRDMLASERPAGNGAAPMPIEEKGQEGTHVAAGLAATVLARPAGMAAKLFGAIATALGGVVSALLPAILAAVFAAVLLTAFLTLFQGHETPGNTEIVAVAREELEAADENIGGSKYKEWYGLDGHWCAMFVTWCADQCGFIESGIVPKTASVAGLHAWYDAKSQYHEKSGYAPKEGDIILFEGAGSSHTGIVDSFDAASMTVTTIEGNTRGGTPFNHHVSRVTKNTYPMSDPRITAFCSPDYPASFGELSGGSNAEMVYRAFVDAGYTPEAAAAVVGNLSGEGGTDASGDIVLDSTESTGEGIGICQWSFSRKTAFLAYAESQGEPWPDTSLKVQLQFMMKELASDGWLWTSNGMEYGDQYNVSHAVFKACKDVAFATTAFCANFERCHEAESRIEERITYAEGVLEQFGDYVAGTGSAGKETESELEDE